MSAGSPSDALSAFATTALNDSRRAAQGEPDPMVWTAFGLGWQMAEIYRPDAPAVAPAVQAGDLPDLSQLSSGDWEEIGLFQLQAGITKLSEPISHAGLTIPDAEGFATELKATSETNRAGALRKFHVELLATLTAANFRLGKAYGLGRALADATRDPSNYRVELQSRESPSSPPGSGTSRLPSRRTLPTRSRARSSGGARGRRIPHSRATRRRRASSRAFRARAGCGGACSRARSRPPTCSSRAIT